MSSNRQDTRTGDVEVGCVEIVAGSLPFCLAVLGATNAARPRLVAPGEEEEAELVHDIRIGHVEVVLEDGDGDEATELRIFRSTQRQRKRTVSVQAPVYGSMLHAPCSRNRCSSPVHCSSNGFGHMIKCGSSGRLPEGPSLIVQSPGKLTTISTPRADSR